MNVLFIMSDEHSGETMGFAGHNKVQTPVLDRLAGEGTAFTRCYTPSPLCTPGRASFFTGKYTHTLGTWDNATPYDGRSTDMANHLHRHGERLTSFGKLDLHPDGQYEGLDATLWGPRNNPQFESFFRDRDVEMGNDLRFKHMGIRTEPSFDERVRDAALEWLRGRQGASEPWVMYVGFLNPHFPFIAPEEKWNKYDKLVTDEDMAPAARSEFPELNEPLRQLRRHFRGDVVDPETLRKAHVGYYAMTEELDANIGRLLQTLKEIGQEEDTLIVYTSDHGEQLGRHGLWWKCCMYEESARVPLILKGPGIPGGQIIDSPVSLLDMFPTICDARGIEPPAGLPGRSLLPLARGEHDPLRADFAFSEYHAHGVPSGMYMIRWQRWKYVYYVGFAPQLFDLAADPREMHDLYPSASASEELRQALEACDSRLRSVCDPEAVDRRAQQFQQETKKRLGLTGYVPPKGMPVPHPEYSE
ncbi:sulfatase-like hydrolase/transferase [Paenibacillus thalictri]|uniref:Sulfatase n=1 Tax=Paenibacillus thalictri TaxID=2527873 RepID=A0A4Q9DM05_9BACL|nr:sulfatase-like hydrolase/transferase [Paenibacillus thalictri]TBL73233.1 sulfatase [Paenibacillus thalictri]